MSSGYEFVGGGFGSSDPNGSDNRSAARTDPAWQNAAFHRAQISNLLIGSTKISQPTLCIWGAGSCTDLDLESFVKRFELTTLVDIDGTSMADGLRLRGLESAPRIETVGDLDITGINDLVKQFGDSKKAKPSGQPDDVRSQRLAEIREAANAYRLDRLEQYDVVASICLLSQLQQHNTENFGESDPAFVEMLQLTRRRHLELLLEHTKPGGSAILITDLTSSDALPEMAKSGDNISELIWKQIEAGNHFHGVNPRGINSDFAQHEQINSQLAKTMVSRPWVWNATKRLYACIAYCMLKK